MQLAAKQSLARRPLIEAGLVVVLIIAFLWFGRHAFPGASLVMGALVLAVTITSHRRAGETARDVGWRLDTAPLASAYLLPVVLIAAAAIGIAAFRLQSLTPVHWLEPTPLRLLVPCMLSGWLQQYLLLGFFYRRSAEWLPTPLVATAVTTGVFAALHIPNAFLVLVTLVAGWLSCAIYRRAPNLLVAGIVHGLIVYMLYVSLPAHVTGGMRVGIDYLRLRG